MTFSEKHFQTFQQICSEWNKAERDLKLAEQVSSKAVVPSINELRYAGRRVVDAILKVLSDSPEEEVSVLLAEARFDCHRARHDALDVATSIIASEIDLLAREVGYDIILKSYPNFAELVASLKKARTFMADSRADRTRRDELYSRLEVLEFPELVEKYATLKASEPVMFKIAKTQRRELVISRIIGFGGFLIGAAGVLIALWK